MKILKIIHGYPPLYTAGSEVYSQSICDELSKKHQVLVFTREENPFKPDFTIRTLFCHHNLSITLVNMPRAKDGFRHRELDGRFQELVSEFSPDLAHIGHLNHLSTGIVDVLVAAGVPIVFTLHDFWLMCPRGQFLQRNFGEDQLHAICSGQDHAKCSRNCYKMFHSGYEVSLALNISYEISHRIPKGKAALADDRHWTDWIEARMDETRNLCEKVNRFIAPSIYLKNRFINDFGIPADRIQYMDYGFPTHYLTPNQNKERSEQYRFGYIGTHIPAKGVNLLIEAFASISDAAELYIWGTKDQQSTKALRQMAAGMHNVHFMGNYVNSNLANEVFSRVDCIVVPSIWGENSPLVIHEAQACHIPVLTADFGGMSEYVHHMVNGVLFKHRDAKSLTEKMIWATQNRKQMEQFGIRGYLYSADGQVPGIVEHCKELEVIYNQIIEHNGK